jgi:hypothetical protein
VTRADHPVKPHQFDRLGLVLRVRWYWSDKLSERDLLEMMDGRLKSSSTLNVRKRVPSYRLSLMKSADHTWLACSGTTSGKGWRVGSRFFARRRMFSCSAQDTR